MHGSFKQYFFLLIQYIHFKCNFYCHAQWLRYVNCRISQWWVSGLWHHCIYAVGYGCFLKVCQWYKRLLLWWGGVSLSSKLKLTVCYIYFAGAGCDLCHNLSLNHLDKATTSLIWSCFAHPKSGPIARDCIKLLDESSIPIYGLLRQLYLRSDFSWMYS